MSGYHHHFEKIRTEHGDMTYARPSFGLPVGTFATGQKHDTWPLWMFWTEPIGTFATRDR